MPDDSKAKKATAAGAHRGLDAESIKTGFADHLKYGLARDRFSASFHARYLALAGAIRARLIERWIETQQTHYARKVKRVYYLSLEHLPGRALGNNVINLGAEHEVRRAMAELGMDWDALRAEEVDPALGKGGLGRLAACVMDSLATMELPAVGYGLRYGYGVFRQRIEDGRQVEDPDDWLRWGNPWEIHRPDYRIPVNFGGRVEVSRKNGRLTFEWTDTRRVIGIPYDTPVVGYGVGTVNTLRLWQARSAEEFRFEDFNAGEYAAAVESKIEAEDLTRVLYPNDKIHAGRELRLRQQYFFVACSRYDILRRCRKGGVDWGELPVRAAIQMNDTHPALAVPELLRLLVDRERLGWDRAWDITVRCLGYTNHTLLPEALESWPLDMIERMLPRHVQIIREIDRKFRERVSVAFPGDEERLRRMSIVDEEGEGRLKMANLCIVGSHSTNGVARLHTELLKARLARDFFEMFPERFHSITNGLTQRRWLLKANPGLAALVTDAIGDGWITDLSRIAGLTTLADDATFRERFAATRRENKAVLSDWMAARHGIVVDPDSVFDVQAKRIHEYKRQLLNALHVVVLYNRLKDDPTLDVVPRTFILSGKAAPGYRMALLVIRFVNNVARVVNADPAVRGRLSVHFLPAYLEQDK